MDTGEEPMVMQLAMQPVRTVTHDETEPGIKMLNTVTFNL